MNISYDYYRVFYYAAKYRSITQAAEVLMSNQPNVTRIIKKLESELGCVLFVRSRQGVQLTPEGEKLFAHVRIAVEHIEAGETELALDRSLQQGTVSIGTNEVALHCLLLQVLKAYRKQNPKIRIRVYSYSTPQAVAALENGLVDLSVVTTPVDVPKSLQMTPIRDFTEVPMCGAAFSHLKNRVLSLADVAEYPMIGLGAHTKTYAFYSELFSQHELVFSPSVEATAADQILPMVRNDLGVGFVPETFLDEVTAADGVFALQLDQPIPTRTICVLKHSGRSLSIAACRLEEMILAAAENQ